MLMFGQGGDSDREVWMAAKPWPDVVGDLWLRGDRGWQFLLQLNRQKPV